ncbi:zinc ribbon domain-containing protein [Pleurocapsales cyanobacterium LEGE 06147]|nr:zinc ribbon domain-containing protein [Pleurocapsales cyanobacterium LEGE 06147]
MAYVGELDTGQKIYLENQGTQTLITSIFSGSGQQQQSSNSISTGSWTAEPEMYKTSNGVIVEITTAGGKYCVQIQGSSMSVMNETPSLSKERQMQMRQVESTPASSMPPMEPMKPMKMGDMEMKMNPMEMRMGNMQMRMGSSTSDEIHQSKRRFCSQCGESVHPNDRFCSSCGHRLD